MKRNVIFIHKRIVLSLCVVLGVASSFSQEMAVRSPKLHLYLLIGQSNMAGRGRVEAQDTIRNPRILSMNRNGDWEVAKEPIHFDKSIAGVGPGLAFAREMLRLSGDSIIIGLIPCAAGGSSIDVWLKDLYWEQTHSFPYNNAILRTKLAQKDGVLKGILWHQGEADCRRDLEDYKKKLIAFIGKIRAEFSAPRLPFVVGELPEFNICAIDFNQALHEIKYYIEGYEVVSAHGLTSNPDGVHFDANSVRELGARYAEKMIMFR